VSAVTTITTRKVEGERALRYKGMRTSVATEDMMGHLTLGYVKDVRFGQEFAFVDVERRE
jgi:hypothetical protein